MIQFILIFIGLILLVPTCLLAGEVLASLLFRRKTLGDQFDGRFAILVPAHNESTTIGDTVKHLKTQLRSMDLLAVVADNCSDDTAEVARQAGATVFERNDTAKRGKGFALAYGIERLQEGAPDAIVFVDADCRLSEKFAITLAAHCVAHQRPVQAQNRMTAPKGHERRFAVAEFAWIIKNVVRPTGMDVLGLPCQLTGTGMAFPWNVMKKIEIASGNIVEDLEMGAKFAGAGHPPLYCESALVLSEFPISEKAEITQRQRWERGALAMLMRNSVGTMVAGFAKRNAPLFFLGLDMTIPPLVIHAAILVGYCALGLMAVLVGAGWLPFVLGLALATMFGISILLAWFSKGQQALPLSMWASLVPFVLKKLRIHGRGAKKTSSEWVRTDRGGEK